MKLVLPLTVLLLSVSDCFAAGSIKLFGDLEFSDTTKQNTAILQGPVGLQGAKGDKGEMGMQGLKGDKGDPGAPGACASGKWILVGESNSYTGGIPAIYNVSYFYDVTNGKITGYNTNTFMFGLILPNKFSQTISHDICSEYDSNNNPILCIENSIGIDNYFFTINTTYTYDENNKITSKTDIYSDESNGTASRSTTKYDSNET
jgi:hypothetical protein